MTVMLWSTACLNLEDKSLNTKTLNCWLTTQGINVIIATQYKLYLTTKDFKNKYCIDQQVMLLKFEQEEAAIDYCWTE